ncbi:MAG: DUF4032 domain-containing protein [Ignavibacteriae bacterium]|nr:DUF4032 domain-containing protein [Ignavibacteriota bacterium]
MEKAGFPLVKPRFSSFPKITFDVDELHLEEIKSLPWKHPITEWRELGIKHLEIKRGIGRHPVIFIEIGNHNYVIKELGYDVALREVNNYKQMLGKGIHTLIPVGCVAREEAPLQVSTQVGEQYERNIAGHTVTLLVDRVLPDSQLYRRAFTFENRKRIWDAIVDLFVEMHSNGVYWGDASLYNTLIKFIKLDVPFIGKKTQLKAILADAETVEVRYTLSDSMRYADVNFFFESMEWINEDLRSEGILRDEFSTEMDKVYVRENYERLYEVAQRSKAFEQTSSLNMKQVLGTVREAVYLDTLQKHIEEHKWYLSEQKRSEIRFSDASQDWLSNIFIPMCELFKAEGVVDVFPGKTASDLYVEIMTHKYYLSQKKQSDVGMILAMRNYAKQFGTKKPPRGFWQRVSRKMLKILGVREQLLLNVRFNTEV